MDEEKEIYKSNTAHPHPNAEISTKLNEIMNSYKNNDIYKIIDYLSEWAVISNPQNTEKHIIEMIRERLERNYNSQKNAELKLGPKDYMNKFFSNESSPESLIESLAYEEELKLIKERLSKRPRRETLSVMIYIKLRLGENKQKNLENHIKDKEDKYYED